MCYARREYAGRGGHPSWSAEVNHNWRKQRCMKGSLVEPELITVTAASLSQETRNRWCRNAVAQSLTKTITVKSSRAEMWDAAWWTKSGKGNVRHLSRHVVPPRVRQASVVKRKLAKDQSAGLKLDNRNTIVKGKKSLPPSQVVTHFQRD